jgi:hypothetical protein
MKLSELIRFLNDSSDCKILYRGRVVEYLNEAGRVDADSSRFFAAGHEHGATHIVHVESYRGDGYESAWGAWIDGCPTIPESELVEAYGPPSTKDGGSFLDMAFAEAREENIPPFTPEWDKAMARVHERAETLMKRCAQDAQDGIGEYPELVEGYESQDNASGGTGVVDVGHYSWMEEADLDEVVIVGKDEEVPS